MDPRVVLSEIMISQRTHSFTVSPFLMVFFTGGPTSDIVRRGRARLRKELRNFSTGNGLSWPELLLLSSLRSSIV